MNNGMIRLCRKLLIFIIPYTLLSILLPILLKSDPMRYFDPEYAWQYQNKEYALSHDDYCRVLIMGDSVSKVGWLPLELSDDTYNYASSGSTPVEEYYCLKEYLENNPAPEWLIYTQHAFHFMVIDGFWDRFVYCHRLNLLNTLEVYNIQRRSIDTYGLLGDNKLLDIALYYSYSPAKYLTAFLLGGYCSRKPLNEERYNYLISHNGAVEAIDNGDRDRLNQIANYNSFSCNRLIDYYFHSILDLCEEYNIKFVYQSAPYPYTTYEAMDDCMMKEYENYMRQIKRDYPNAVFNEEFYAYDDDLFVDSAHLNHEGSMEFTNEMRKKYPYIFGELN